MQENRTGVALKDQVKYGLEQSVFATYLSKLSTQSWWDNQTKVYTTTHWYVRKQPKIFFLLTYLYGKMPICGEEF